MTKEEADYRISLFVSEVTQKFREVFKEMLKEDPDGGEYHRKTNKEPVGLCPHCWQHLPETP